jgi:hypothetical protein
MTVLQVKKVVVVVVVVAQAKKKKSCVLLSNVQSAKQSALFTCCTILCVAVCE